MMVFMLGSSAVSENPIVFVQLKTTQHYKTDFKFTVENESTSTY